MVQEAEEELLASQVTPNRPDLPEAQPPRSAAPGGPALPGCLLPARPHPEDNAAGDCHQLRLPLRSIDLASGFVYSNSWTGGILIRVALVWGGFVCWVFFLNDNEETL